jgi:hypothetical protein
LFKIAAEIKVSATEWSACPLFLGFETELEDLETELEDLETDISYTARSYQVAYNVFDA